MDNYYNRPEVSNSDLSALKEDHIPTHIRASAQRFGRLVDAHITEPHTLNGNVLDEDVYTDEEIERAIAMKAAFMNDPLCARIHRQSVTQHIMIKHGLKIRYKGFEFELDVRCKWDLWMLSLLWGGDVKVTSEVSQKGFEKACSYYDYDRGRAFYMDIAGSGQDIIIGISRKNFQVFKVPVNRSDRIYNSGKAKYEELAYRYYQIYIQQEPITCIPQSSLAI